MEKNKFLFVFTLAVTSLVIGVTAFQGHSISKEFFASKGNTTHTLTLDSSDTPSALTDDYQNNVSGTLTTTDGNSVNMSFVNAKRNSGGFVTLANHGKIYNFGTGNNQLTGVDGISFTGSGSLLFKPCAYQNILAELDPVVVTANAEMVSVPNCDYFEIEAGDSGASITSLNFNYSCNPDACNPALLAGTYTGMGGGYTYKLTIDSDNTASLVTLDKATNDNYSGSISMSSKTSVTFTGSSLTYNMTYSNGYTLTGTASGSVPAIIFNKVFKVEDFESYGASGQGYTNATTKYQTTGLRSQYYADYYTGSSSGEIGGSGWPVMTSTDNSNLGTVTSHSGSKSGIFKFSNGSQMRYFSINELYGVNRMIGKGTKLSFWARGAYSNSTFSNNHSSNIPIKVYAYYATPLNSSNQTSVRTTGEFVVEAGTIWQHFEIALDSSKAYYGIGIYSNQSSGTNAYVAFDDFEIYSTSPYIDSPYPTGTFKGAATINSNNFEIVISIGTRSNGLIGVRLSNQDAGITGFTYDDSTKQISISTNGSYTYSVITATFGTITGTFDPANNRIINIRCSGSIKDYVSNNGSITATRANTVSGKSYFDNFDADTATLQSKYKRRYDSGAGWQVDTSNADRITSNVYQSISGSSLKRRAYSGGPVTLNLNSDLSTAIKVKNIHFWVYNSSNSDIVLRMWGYKAKNFGSNFETGNVTAKANGWTYLAMGFTEASIYNFQIADFTNSGVYLSFDNIYLF